MNFVGQVPVKNPSTLTSHFGPGSQWGKPYYHLGQECEKPGVPRGTVGDPLGLSRSASSQTRINEWHKAKTLRVFADPPSARSCVVTRNKDGLVMDSLSHYTKIGSKHMCAPRPDHSHALHRSMTNPEIHPWSRRRDQLRDPTGAHFNAAFSTTTDEIGKFYHSHMIADPGLLPKAKFEWFETKRRLK
eukprot:TRINITY_DN72746_c0_g1_i1.p1 TRINITY_DN72746_c0_g1~~TRINITY_DN72746_c0_g1_i1.p1  ORF type:complete len:188 (-),score=31.28 TRINITY_DN72746_c0_g1_i1:197-760(-)